MRRFFFLLTLFSASLCGADQWVRVTTPHFELYTTAGEKKGRDLILYFEQVKSFFAQASPVKADTSFPVRIVVFHSEKQYKPYSPSEAAAAYYTPGRYRDYIVMSDAETEHLPAAIHEYTHLVVNHSGLKLPVWLNEGWADVYSTLKPLGKKTMIGDLIAGRVHSLQTDKWLSFDELTSVGLKSATYNEKNRAGIFYAESWALVHMLYISPEYSQKFSTFVSLVHSGKSAAESCQTAYGVPASKVYADLQAYLKRNQLYGALFDVKLTKSEQEAESSQVTNFESQMVLADLLSVIDKREKAGEAFEKLGAENPRRPEIARSLGYLAWQNNDREKAREQFEKAFDEGDRDPQMCFHLAMFEFERGRADGAAADRGIAALKRAVEVKPDYTDASMQLGFAQLNKQDYKAALSTLLQIHKVDDEHAPGLFNALAYAHLQTGYLTEARQDLNSALKWSKSYEDKKRAQDLLDFLKTREEAQANSGRTSATPSGASVPVPFAPEPLSAGDARPRLVRPPESPEAPENKALPQPERNPFVQATDRMQRAEGTAKNLDCERKTFQAEIDGKVASFAIDPEKVLLRHNGADSFEFTCGPQKPFHVILDFAVSEKPSGDVKGTLRGLEF